ncbi:MAG: DivIVA domain-containing protein [Moorella humiferrea]|uniref:Septum site-determining protein DivIVA n=1 Tax=Neomoorella humiferrea TaxID=676965 RepID=A0A2T0AMS0_9FIRM|nr:DivIVA domain-containing protein [Moorella humiferrea]MBE3573495.1 DivIVA domain-containing protein [Moorella humiferrea]PRR70175.1 Septum site-determining protein DivIVA [Moorella humiferrea]
MLAPLDINKKEFRRAFRGYSCEEVDEFLEQVLRDYGQIYRENQELREKNLRLTEELERYANLEQVIKDALVVAQQAAEETRRNAQREAGLIIQEAENKAREILNQARLEVEKAERYRKELEASTAAFKTRLRSFLKAQMELLAVEEAAAAEEKTLFDGENIPDESKE